MASLLILAYNEENTIEEVIEKYFDHFENIILIDDFKTPGKPYGYDSYKGSECSKEYIQDLLKPVTDYIYFAEEPSLDGQGCGVIFPNRTHDEIKDNMDKLGIFGEKL